MSNGRDSVTPLHIGIAGPIATEDMARLLDRRASRLPRGFPGAPFLTTLIAELIARGHHVSAFTLSSDMPLDSDATVVAHGKSLALHYVPMRPKAWPFNGRRAGRIVDLYGFERRGLECAMRRASPDVVHAHWAYEFAWAALSSGLPHVVTCHDSPLRIPRFYRGLRQSGYRWLRAGMACHVLRRARQVTTVSPYLAESIASLCRVPISVVPNPIGPLVLERRRLGNPAHRRVITVANGWSDFKNQSTALRAFSALSQTLPNVELLAYGHDFGKGQRAECWFAENGLKGSVVFAGIAAHEIVLDAMAHSDILLHTSLEESFGMVLAEAMAMGLPIVAGKRSGAVPWVVGSAGSLVDVRDADAVATALREILIDPELAMRLGHAGRVRVESSFAAEGVARAYEREYVSALAQRRNS